ncbi:MAG: type III-B CRISPR-associated protein Cas10/Cmr2 [Myxococcales bacterium]|nr:type III-B CRISPR-associated protein Cas10/Cmr2 [Myxococcales bacterium]
MAANLLLISVGPVQGFIAAGRRGQDLWAGSQLLSDVSATIARAVGGASATLIFPAGLGTTDGSAGPSVANKILVQLPDDQDPADVAQAATKAANAWLEGQFERLFPWHASALDVERARQQILGTGRNDGMLELFWAAAPIATTYGAAREQVEAALAARKNTRDWGPVAWGAMVPKSPIDGERETVVLERVWKRFRNADTAQATRDEARRLRLQLGIEPDETLDGPGMLKRLQQVRTSSDQPPRIHGTAHMAAAPLLRRIAARHEEARVSAYIKALADLGIPVEEELRIRIDGDTHVDLGGVQTPRAFAADGSAGFDGLIFFEGQLEKLCQTDDAEQDAAVLMQARRRLRQLLRHLDLAEGPTPYYALIQADGDQMGRVLSDLAKDRDDGLERHQHFGRTLESEFASQCPALIASHGGSLIYAGGDDVLALVPLHTLLEVCEALRTLFAEVARQAVGDSPVKPPTLSIGVAICHHLHPMFDARQLAREAEHLAKTGRPGVVGRNALAITMDKRSGSTVSAVGSFAEAPHLVDRLWLWMGMLARGDLPDGVAFELEESMRPFELATAGADEAARALLRRILVRKRDDRGELLGAEVRALVDQELAPRPGEAVADAARRISVEIQIARLLLRARKDAEWEVRR